VNVVAPGGWEPDPAWAQAEDARNRAEEQRKAKARADAAEPDPDFTALAIDLTFTVEGAPSKPDYPDKVTMPGPFRHARSWNGVKARMR
jgi:hypothetical protein